MEDRVCVSLVLRFELGLLTTDCVKLAPVATAARWSVPIVSGVASALYDAFMRRVGEAALGLVDSALQAVSSCADIPGVELRELLKVTQVTLCGCVSTLFVY